MTIHQNTSFHKSSVPRTGLVAFLAAAVSAIALMGFAPAASAGHDSHFKPKIKHHQDSGFSISWNFVGADCGPAQIGCRDGWRRGRGRGHGGHGYRPSYRDIQFDRGFNKGQRQGFDAGYRDGLYGRGFCGKAPSIYGPRPYRKGFKKGFKQGYKDGFYAGKEERNCGRRGRGRGGYGRGW